MIGQRLNAHLPWLLLMILITIQSSLSGFQLPPLGLQFEDKIVHFFIFGVLAWLMIRGFTIESNVWIHQNRFAITLTLAILFAISDEGHQYLVKSRNADWLDLLADAVGIFYFTILFRYKEKKGLLFKKP